MKLPADALFSFIFPSSADSRTNLSTKGCSSLFGAPLIYSFASASSYSTMADTSKLRWALYEDVYQPALVFPPEELLEMELPANHSVVYLLGLDSNVVVPDASVSEYDPRDAAKMSHPAAAVGVAMAQQILEGFQGGSAGAEDAEETQPGASELRLLDDDHYGDGDASDNQSEEAAEARRRRHDEKQQRKEEKRKAKEAKKAAKAAVKREREEITSAPALRRADRSASDDEDDEDGDALLAASAIEEKYGSRKAKPERSNKDPSWAALEEDLFSDDDDGEDEEGAAAASHSRTAVDRHRSLRSGNRMGQALAALNAKSAMQDIAGISGSCPYVQPYLMEVHYEYEQLAQEATAEGLLLSMQKGEVVRALDDELRQRAAQRVFLEAAQRQRRSSLATADNADAVRNEIDALDEAIAKMDAPLSVVAAVRRLVSKQMPEHAIAFDRTAAARARRAVQRRTRTFQDVSVVTLVDHLRSVDATPREDGADVMRRYIQQRRQHEELKSNFRGLSKTGFYAVPKPMEKWRRGRDMMVLANVGAEAQRVLPTSYISQAHSTMVQRMREHAEKRYDRVAVTARDGASFLDANSFSGGGGNGRLASASTSLGVGGAGQLTLQQQRLATAGTGTYREAFFQFHALRCDTEAPVTLETVALNPVMAGSGLSQNILPSMGDINASTEPAGNGMEESVRTDDGGVSQHSYSTHSAAPSSYAYIFESETHTRRPHRQRGGSVDGGNGASSRASSRASSVGSNYSEASGHRRHRSNSRSRHGENGTKSSAHNGAAALAANSADWRGNAKRSIMEQLTLYCRGRGGKPAILTTDQCREICRTLLERAMRAEAERQGLSLAVQSNNIAAPFTKTTEQRLKKSVDHYLERRLAHNTLSAQGAGGVLGTASGTGGVLPTPAEEAVLPYEGAAVARQRVVADEPLYEV